MLEDALLVLVYLSLIAFLITLIVLCIKVMGTLSRADKLIDNITKKAESLDGVFEMIDYTTNKFGRVGETIVSGITSFVQKIFNRRGKREREEMYYE